MANTKAPNRRALPGLPATANVNCLGKRHLVILNADGRLSLPHHPQIRDEIEAAKLYQQLGDSTKGARCVEMFMAWQFCFGGENKKNLIDYFTVHFKAHSKAKYRFYIHDDTLVTYATKLLPPTLRSCLEIKVTLARAQRRKPYIYVDRNSRIAAVIQSKLQRHFGPQTKVEAHNVNYIANLKLEVLGQTLAIKIPDNLCLAYMYGLNSSLTPGCWALDKYRKVVFENNEFRIIRE